MNPNPSPPPAAPPVRPGRLVAGALVLIAAGLAIGLLPRYRARAELAAETRADTVPSVVVISPGVERPDLGTPLSADVQPFIAASLHARAGGYLRGWYADIGDAVTNGQLLAEIDTPELDQQIAQAQAEVAQVRAALDLAKITADRWSELLKTASVSEQEAAEKNSDFALKQANLAAAQANLDRLRQLKEFDRITAPFAGTVTRRNTDIGELISADSGPELFHLAQTDPLRVYVQVPQTLAHGIRPGEKADLSFQEAPNRTFTAVVTRTAGAVDPGSRTLQVELQLANPRNEILAGSYAQARFLERADARVLTIADNALIFRAQGAQLAVVGPDNQVSLRAVKLGRDFGNTVEVLAGLNADDRVVNNPPDAIADGETVEVLAASTNAPAK